MTKIDLFSLSIFIVFVLFRIPGTCVFYNLCFSFMRHFEADFYDVGG